MKAQKEHPKEFIFEREGIHVLYNKLRDKIIWSIASLSMMYLFEIMESIWDRRLKGIFILQLNATIA